MTTKALILLPLVCLLSIVSSFFNVCILSAIIELDNFLALLQLHHSSTKIKMCLGFNSYSICRHVVYGSI
jgi:hypothetical protein